MKRVVITGMSLVSSLGNTPNDAFERLHTYENCVDYQSDLDQYEKLTTRLAARVKNFTKPEHFTRKITRSMGTVAIYATACTEEALKDAGLLNDEIITSGKTGVSYGSSSGSLDAIMDFYAMSVNHEVKNLNSGSYLKMMPQTTAVNISVYFKTTGRLIPTSTACTSGSMGIGAAYEAIKSGQQTVMIAGGAEEYHPTQVAVFDTLYATSAKNDTPKLTPSPFDKNRDGLVIGEGAGTLILEEYEHAKARGAKIYAEIVGYGQSADAYDMVAPDPEGKGAEYAINAAMKDAGITKSDIDYINTHGTSTHVGDIAESKTIERIFGNKDENTKLLVSSTKSMTGHMLGAAGAIEAIFSIETTMNDVVPPTINLENQDEEVGNLDYVPNKAREHKVEYALSNSFGFGGTNAVLIFKKYN